MSPAIQVRNLGKHYRINHQANSGGSASYKTLRESLTGLATAPLRRLRRNAGVSPATREDFWALKDVSFDVQPGEVVGIIGRNGAGKSTLLKILSRITKPSTGSVTLNGRVGSLLEVGTGFHPELTGRENIFLNGSILGMKRAEIQKQFDAIVGFSGVEKFLDTPVKRYSSGMSVRLAFAVAAHLEPEILIIDEVLAVGDAAFQRRCFRKLDDFRGNGRTVLVVSHNLTAIRSICSRAVNLENGRLISQGNANSEVAFYLSKLAEVANTPISDRTDREGSGKIRVKSFTFLDSNNLETTRASCGATIQAVIECAATSGTELVDYVALSCWSTDGTMLFGIDSQTRGIPVCRKSKRFQFRCKMPRLPLPPGNYTWNVAIAGGGMVHDHLFSVGSLEVLPGDFYSNGQFINSPNGMFLLDHEWRVD